jgi:Methyltransferase domain
LRRLGIETFRSNVVLFNGDRLPHHIQLSSDNFFSSWNANEVRGDFFGRTVKLGGPIVFAYIDGDHTYEQSKRDFLNVDRHLVKGGFIIFDDSADNSDWGSRLSAQEASKLPRYELVAKNPNYCIRKLSSS